MGAKSMMRTDRVEPARRSKEVDWGGKGKGKMIMEPRKVQLGDNERALALRKNRQVGARTKHIDIRHHFMRVQVGRRIVKSCSHSRRRQ